MYFVENDWYHLGTKVYISNDNGDVIYETPLSTYLDSITNTELYCHVDERADGTVRILINAFDKLYYLDEQLNILNSVDISVEYNGIHMESDGVYILGSEMPQMARVDMNAGTVDRIETMPVPPEWIYSSKFQYGGDGLLYCEHDGAIYQCDGEGNLKEILRWDDGAYDGNGKWWVLDENSVFFMPLSGNQMSTSYNTLTLLKTGMEDVVLDRRVIKLANLSWTNQEWLRTVIDMFNNENEDYFIDYLDFTQDDDDAAKFNTYLLTEDMPDIVIFANNNQSRDYVEKDLFVDLMPYYGDTLLGCAASAYTEADGTLPMLPISMQIDTYAAATTVQGDALSWDEFYAMQDAGSDDAVISYDNLSHLHTISLSDFYDYEQKTSTFDSPAFVERIRFLEKLQTQGLQEEYGALNRSLLTGMEYGLRGGSRIRDAIRTGEVKLLYVPFDNPEAYAVLKQIFGDTPFTFCGYPTVEGTAPGAIVKSMNLLSLYTESASLGGCRAFVDYVLSVDIQASEFLCAEALPVTYNGMESVLETYRYLYYPQQFAVVEIDGFMQSNPSIPLTVFEHSAEPLEGYILQSNYREQILTDEDFAFVLSFLDSCVTTASADKAIAAIVEEELSAYRGGARSLEDAAKLIGSRVNIYLNE